MSKFFLAGLAMLLAFLWKAAAALGFTDTDINTAPWDGDELIPAYKNPGNRQWGQRVANNLAYLFRRSDQNIFIQNDTYGTPSEDKTYDADRKYIGKYMKLEIGLSASAFTMPFGIISNADALTTEWILLTSSFQTLPKNGLIQMRAENAGGFTFRITVSTGTRYLLGSVTECRLVAGT